MASSSFILILGSALGQQYTGLFCKHGGATPEDLQICTELIAQANTPQVSFKCEASDGVEDCFSREDSSTLAMVILDAGNVFEAHEFLQAAPFISEDHGVGTAHVEHYAVVATSAYSGVCSNGTIGTNGYAGLEGKNLCSSGYGTSFGWTFPIFWMISQGIITAVDNDRNVTTDAESAATFFGSMCVPGAAGLGP